MRKLKLEELGRLSPEAFKSARKIPVILVMDSIRSALNVGALFRTADAFGIEKIILCGITAQPPHREITKTAIGATETVQWEYQQSIKTSLSSLKKEGYTTIGIEQTDDSQDLTEYSWPDQKIALVLGNEVEGLSEEALKELDHCVEIPQFGTKHSLNVSVCGGIILWELNKHFRHLLTLK
jgi:tRNA G18 (ribose-2'-O)-methylase SpoU